MLESVPVSDLPYLLSSMLPQKVKICYFQKDRTTESGKLMFDHVGATSYAITVAMDLHRCWRERENN
jgi:hypothetical protein